jgi:nucleotidyltransferase/DNA polymerase involved in DNA repair
MPRVKAGEMSLPEIRNLARQHNKASTIKDVDKLSRSALINEIEKMGYRLDHEKKRIIKRTMTNEERKAQNKSVSPEGEKKPQKRTIRKKLIAGGDKPVLATEKTIKTKQASDKKKKIAKYDQMVRGYPDIPPNIKGKKI